MASQRAALPPRLETDVLVQYRRRCCLCYYLQDRRSEVRQGQIAHLNKKSSDHRFENLVWLCMEHHDAFDSRTSQSKGYTTGEVRHHRDALLKELSLGSQPEPHQTPTMLPTPEVDAVHPDLAGERPPRPWRFPLWQTANQLEYFAYQAAGDADGVCLIERIDLPDGRVVVACVQTPGNPGRSITNAVEEICEQVCSRFDIRPDRLVWLENYSFIEPDEWSWVTFTAASPSGAAGSPMWRRMTPKLWRSLGLKPRTSDESDAAGIVSKLDKSFPWPPEGA